MTETKDTTDKTLRGGGRKPLSLQRTVESGHVRQNFSHGRSKSVVVEKRRTRKLAGPGAQSEQPEGGATPPPSGDVARRPARPETQSFDRGASAAGQRGLSNEERDARARALAAARERDDVERVEAEARAEQAAAEARNEAAMRQAYARAISRRCNDVPRYLLSQMPCSVRDRFCPFRLAAEKPAAMAAPRPPEENRSARYEWL